MPTAERRRDYGQKLRAVRESRHLSAQDVADYLRDHLEDGKKMSRQAVTAWERGENAPTRPAALLLDLLFGEPLSELLDYDGSRTMLNRLDDLDRRVTALEAQRQARAGRPSKQPQRQSSS